MNQDYIIADPWSIVEEGFNPERVQSSESLFSIGNGAMGQRANFEETYSGETFQGSYIGGVYYPDKTRVGWWKNGYPEYFAKVLNAPNWIGIKWWIDGEELDLAACEQVKEFRRELNMKEGWYRRSFRAVLSSGQEVVASTTRFLSLELEELGAIRYELELVGSDADIKVMPFLDSGIKNKDSNWDDDFWKTDSQGIASNRAHIRSHTLKTEFQVCTYMQAQLFVGEEEVQSSGSEEKPEWTALIFESKAKKGQKIILEKFGGYTVSRNHPKEELVSVAEGLLDQAQKIGFEGLLAKQIGQWAQVWEMSDITIDGDIKAQQGIRFNIFQLNQTYSGKDSGLNIGPKGFTGEKYGGSTYWDTEAYCLPFYMATKNQQVARNLLKYRYDQLDKAIENAQLLGFKNGAALYPMVTMNGEECHNEWEITFEEIHRNGAIAFAIFNYIRYTGDYSYMPEMGLEVLIGIARFWAQRVHFSEHRQKYVMLGVTGPNEYENNINNNWYTNYLAQWCMKYAREQVGKVKEGYPEDFARIQGGHPFERSRTIEMGRDCAEYVLPLFRETSGLFAARWFS